MLDSYTLYKERLQRLLPLSLFIEIHELLLFISVIRNNYEYNIIQFATCIRISTRKKDRNKFQVPKTRLKKTNTDFFVRCLAFFNIIIRNTPKQLSEIRKSATAETYWKFFAQYSEMDSCTWLILIQCGICNPNNKNSELIKLYFGFKPMG